MPHWPRMNGNCAPVPLSTFIEALNASPANVGGAAAPAVAAAPMRRLLVIAAPTRKRLNTSKPPSLVRPATAEAPPTPHDDLIRPALKLQAFGRDESSLVPG